MSYTSVFRYMSATGVKDKKPSCIVCGWQVANARRGVIAVKFAASTLSVESDRR